MKAYHIKVLGFPSDFTHYLTLTEAYPRVVSYSFKPQLNVKRILNCLVIVGNG